MVKADTLMNILRREVDAYADADGWKSDCFLLENEEQQIFGVTLVLHPDHPDGPSTVTLMLAQVIGQQVAIFTDITDRPLYEALMKAGIPRERIVLVYAGEILKETSLADVVQEIVKSYAVPAFDATMYYFVDETAQEWAVVTVPQPQYPRKEYAVVVIMAHIVDDFVIVDEDITDRPLYEALMKAGIPRERIVLAYAGETLEQKAEE